MKKLFILIFILVVTFLGACQVVPEVVPEANLQVSEFDYSDSRVWFNYLYTGEDTISFILFKVNTKVYEEVLEEKSGHYEYSNLESDTAYEFIIYGDSKVLFRREFTSLYADTVAPTVTVDENITFDLTNNAFDEIKRHVYITDNVDGIIPVVESMFTIPSITKGGTYTVTYSVSDVKGNTTTGSFTVTVVTDQTPADIETEDTYFSYDTTLDVPDLKSFFTVVDNLDGNITITDSNLSVTNATLKNGLNVVTCTVEDSSGNISTATIYINVGDEDIRVHMTENMQKVDAYMPSTGDVKVLVIPVSIGSHPKTEEMRSNIEKTFFGTSTETGWESLSSYYYKSSYGALRLTGTVTDWYQASRTQNYYATYEDENNYYYGSTMILEEALTYFKDTYNYDDYDSNNDGMIDAVYLVYNVEIGGTGSEAQEDFYWAFTYWDFYCDERSYSTGAVGYSYVFASYNFITEELQYSKNKLSYNAQTFIHETGHLMGLDDYYDTDSSDSYKNAGGYGGADMMDYNFGDHHPYSKFLLGWSDPAVVTKSGTYFIPSSTKTGYFILIPTSSTSFNSKFTEYFIIDFYTFEGLNELEAANYYETDSTYAGVRVSLCNATLTNANGYYEFKYNNSSTKYKQIEMMEADYNGTLMDVRNTKIGYTSMSDFYTQGMTFGNGNYANYKTMNGTIKFTMKVDSLTKDYSIITITFK